ncbi:MAG: DUF2752 domain-containing protein [Lachnospiraceae bacterium]
MNQIKRKRINTEQLKRDIELFRKQWRSIVLICLLLAVVQYKFHGLCSLRILTGFPCPACGMTRAVILFFHGHIGESLRMQPLWPFVIFVGVFSLYCRYIGLKRKYLYYSYTVAVVIALFILYFYRMYLYFPYQEPMTYHMDNILFQIWKGR